ncbi:tetratricopeptide repeat protein [Parahaliea maris]|uniref:Tetratricopeptide repeat protein n=1 Tax=Parahaliea maris TaxID=2716870 RepID=A0A5C9A5W6_9GAMM|nr:tetratricopeptide repeat protein [Parahaliea maris]TXS95429.1 tetratricopeptide repeat protein [Parahaliea maris]
MRVRAYLIQLSLLTALLPATVTHAAHPNNSIAPKPPPPTRYGLTIKRADDERFAPFVPDQSLNQAPRGPYLAMVESAELAAGPYSPDLVEPLHTLGQSLQAAGRYNEAIRHYRRALHLLRVNQGLYDPAQLPLLEALAESLVALGDLPQADRTHDYLFRVQQATYAADSTELLQAASRHAEWKRSTYLAGYGFDTFRRLVEMHRTHDDVADALAETDPYDASRLPHLYRRMRAEYLVSRYEGEQDPVFSVRGSGVSGERYAVSTDLDFEDFRLLKKHNFRNGRMTMEQIIDVLEHRQDTAPEDLVRAHVALGDWFMWWDQPARAIGSYESAWAAMDPHGGGAPVLFEEPVELPADKVFQPTLPAVEGGFNARARVRFDVSRLGQVRNIEFLEVETEQEEKRETARLALYRLLHDFRFRPILRDGEAVAARGIEREYRFEY